MTTEQVELLPCPFCGSDGKIAGSERDGFHAGCTACYCEVGEAFDRDAMPAHMFQTEELAIAAWNTRTQASPALPSEEMRTELLELLELGGDYAAEVFNEFPNKTSPCALEVKRNITRFNAIYTAMQRAGGTNATR